MPNLEMQTKDANNADGIEVLILIFLNSKSMYIYTTMIGVDGVVHS